MAHKNNSKTGHQNLLYKLAKQSQRALKTRNKVIGPELSDLIYLIRCASPRARHIYYRGLKFPIVHSFVWRGVVCPQTGVGLVPATLTGRIKAIENALVDFAKTRGISLSPKVPLQPTEYALNALAICEAAQVPDLIDTVIESKVPLAVLRQMLQNYRASADQAIETINRLPQSDGSSMASQIWAQRQGQA